MVAIMSGCCVENIALCLYRQDCMAVAYFWTALPAIRQNCTEHARPSASPQAPATNLCYAVLCYTMLCCTMLCCAMLCYAVLCCAMRCNAVSHCLALGHASLCLMQMSITSHNVHLLHLVCRVQTGVLRGNNRLKTQAHLTGM